MYATLELGHLEISKVNGPKNLHFTISATVQYGGLPTWAKKEIITFVGENRSVTTLIRRYRSSSVADRPVISVTASEMAYH